MKFLMEELVAAGYPIDEIFHHESDLYVYVTPVSTAVIEAYYKEMGWERTWNAPIFRDQITGKPMYDAAFQFVPKLYEKLKEEYNALHNNKELAES